MSKKKTTNKVAEETSSVLKNRSTGRSSKSVAGSSLYQVNTKKETSPKVASTASKVIKVARTKAGLRSVATLSHKIKPKKGGDDDKGTNSGGPRRAKK